MTRFSRLLARSLVKNITCLKVYSLPACVAHQWEQLTALSITPDSLDLTGCQTAWLGRASQVISNTMAEGRLLVVPNPQGGT